jgi:antitoxin VapB
MKIAKLFQNGQSQAVRLPKEFRFEGVEGEVFIKKVGKMIILLPIKNPWKLLFEGVNKFSDDFMDKREQPKQQEREDLFS